MTICKFAGLKCQQQKVSKINEPVPRQAEPQDPSDLGVLPPDLSLPGPERRQTRRQC